MKKRKPRRGPDGKFRKRNQGEPAEIAGDHRIRVVIQDRIEPRPGFWARVRRMFGK